METISDSSGIRGSVESLIGGRQENQDSYGMAETRLGMLVVVCDGMGGGPAGKTASTIATQAIIDYVSGAAADANPASVLEDSVVAANEAVLAAVVQNPAFKGMGTTCVCVLIAKTQAYVVHVGDSRCYQIRGGKMVYRSADHSYVGELVRRGTMTEEEARTSRYSNVITRAIGAGPEIQPEVDIVSYKPGDRFALMSDGIWGSMPEQNLVDILSEKDDPATLVPEIAQHVDAIGKNKGGGHDNLTLALVELPGPRQSLNDKLSGAAASARTVNSRAGQQPVKTSPAKSPVQKAAPAAKNGNADYKLEEMAEETELKKKKTKHSSVTWILAAGLFICIAVICYLLVWNSDDQELIAKGEEQQQTTVVDPSADEARIDDQQDQLPPAFNQTPEQKQSPETKEGEANPAKPNAKELAKAIDKANKDSKSQPDTEKSDKSGKTGKSGSLEYLKSALAQFDGLKSYEEKDLKKNSKGRLEDNEVRRLREKRGKLVDEIITTLNRAKASGNAEVNDKIDRVVNKIKKKRTALSNVDQKWGRTTDDGEKFIKEFKGDINKIK